MTEVQAYVVIFQLGGILAACALILWNMLGDEKSQ